jgi:RNA polymerase sigma factor (sigma-70 family)
VATVANRPSHPWQTLEELVRQIQSGEELRYGDFALFLMTRLPGWFRRKGVPETDVEDLAVDCIIRCRIAIDTYTYRPGAGIQALIFEIARHQVADFFRGRVASTNSIDDLKVSETPTTTPEILSELFGESEGPDPQVIRAVNDALAKLPAQDQEILHLRYYSRTADSEKTFTSIGHLLNVPEGTARQRHNRALKRLEAILIGDTRMKLRAPTPQGSLSPTRRKKT